MAGVAAAAVSVVPLAPSVPDQIGVAALNPPTKFPPGVPPMVPPAEAFAVLVPLAHHELNGLETLSVPVESASE